MLSLPRLKDQSIALASAENSFKNALSASERFLQGKFVIASLREELLPSIFNSSSSAVGPQ